MDSTDALCRTKNAPHDHANLAGSVVCILPKCSVTFVYVRALCGELVWKHSQCVRDLHIYDSNISMISFVIRFLFENYRILIWF